MLLLFWVGWKLEEEELHAWRRNKRLEGRSCVVPSCDVTKRDCRLRIAARTFF